MRENIVLKMNIPIGLIIVLLVILIVLAIIYRLRKVFFIASMIQQKRGAFHDRQIIQLARNGSGANKGSRNIDQMLRDEYERWSRTQHQIAIISGARMTARDIYEARTILERWHVSAHNAALDGNIIPNLRDHQVTRKMREEFLEKQIFREDEVDAIIAQILEAPSDPVPAGARPLVFADNVRYARFSQNFARDRISLLERIAQNNGYDREKARAYIVACAMRYASMVPGGQQWSVPARTYDILINVYGVSREGFASPFNSQIARHMIRDPSLRFCSLFPDLDEPFGSIGSFFAADLRDKVTLVNPPFIEDMINDVVRKCHETLESSSANGGARMFVVVPNWEDAQYYQDLCASPYLERKLTHEPMTHFYEDANHYGKVIVARHGQTIFVLSRTKDGPSYDDITASLRPPPRDIRGR